MDDLYRMVANLQAAADELPLLAVCDRRKSTQKRHPYNDQKADSRLSHMAVDDVEKMPASVDAMRELH